MLTEMDNSDYADELIKGASWITARLIYRPAKLAALQKPREIFLQSQFPALQPISRNVELTYM